MHQKRLGGYKQHFCFLSNAIKYHIINDDFSLSGHHFNFHNKHYYRFFGEGGWLGWGGYSII